MEPHHDKADDGADAAAWVVRLSGPETDFEEFQAFEAWLKGSPDRACAYDRALKVWMATGPDAGACDARDPQPLEQRRRQPQRRQAQIRWAAATLPLAAAVLLTLGMLPRTRAYQTTGGRRETVVLKDGSQVALNTDTRLLVRLSGRARDVTFVEGEAAFDVAKDASRPFVIRIGDRRVRVVGTEFDVRARGPALTVSVRRGIVEVRGAEDEPPVRLVRGEQILFPHAGRAYSVNAVDADSPFAWKEDRLVYRRTTLGHLVAALNDRFGAPYIQTEPAAAKLPFSGVVVLDTRERVVHRLALVEPLSTRATPKGIVLSVDPKLSH